MMVLWCTSVYAIFWQLFWFWLTYESCCISAFTAAHSSLTGVMNFHMLKCLYPIVYFSTIEVMALTVWSPRVSFRYFVCWCVSLATFLSGCTVFVGTFWLVNFIWYFFSDILTTCVDTALCLYIVCTDSVHFIGSNKSEIFLPRTSLLDTQHQGETGNQSTTLGPSKRGGQRPTEADQGGLKTLKMRGFSRFFPGGER